jgi:hypothetical protein
VVSVVGAATESCSPKSDNSGGGLGNTGSVPAFSGGAPGSGGGGAGPGSGGFAPGNTGGAFIPVGGGESRGGGPSNECGEVVQPPETVFIDASVTDTVVTYSPIALYVMMDRSSSMNPTLWPVAQNAITAFAQDPGSAGMDIGLGVFPPMSNNNAPDCTAGTDCGAPVVEIASLPNNASPLIAGMNQANPGAFFGILTTPTECGLRGMIAHCTDWTTRSSEQCVAVLATDGEPFGCDVNAQNLVNIVADGKTKGVTTFTLGLPGSNQAFLDQLAQAGGTNASIPVANQQDFIAALTAIRGKVTTQHTTHTTQQVYAPSRCSWNIPPPKDGKEFDRDKVNLKFAPLGGAASDFTRFDDEAACGATTTGWRYDIDAKDLSQDPKQVILCPATCDAVKAQQGATVNIAFGCATKIVQ